MLRSVIKFLITLLLIVISQPSGAQLNTTNQWQVGVFFGPFIPTAVGFEEILQAQGLRINKGMSHYRPEITLLDASKNNEKFQFAALSIKNPIRIQDLEEIRPFLIIGLHSSRYKNSLTEGTVTGSGFHLAGGFEYLIAGNTFFRADFLYGNGPARQLLVSLGLQIDIGGSNTN